MNVKIAKSAGFCFGVKRAVDSVYEQIEKGGLIYTYGPIIHNKEVVKDMESKGVKVINSPDELDVLPKGCVIIRSHGVSEEVYKEIENKGFEIFDATCPFVKRIHKIVNKASNEGKQIVIIGNPGHPEVEGIKGWSNSDAYVIENTEELMQIKDKLGKDLCVVAQTTFNHKKFEKFVELFEELGYNDSIIANTICSATDERQKDAAKLAAEADAMIVIGDLQSSNSMKLFEICKEHCENAYFVQTLKDLHLKLPANANLVGITAGASTPNNIIEEVQNNVRINF